MEGTITITKIDTVHRMLGHAIELWFYDKDPIPIHTLSAAAYQIVHDLNTHNKGPNLLLDSNLIKEEYRREFKAEIKKASNFMKHAERAKGDKLKAIEFYPESNYAFIIFAIIGLKYLGENLTIEEVAFERWQVFRNPDLLTDAGKKLFERTFTEESLVIVRGIKKCDFLDKFRCLV